MRRGEMVFVDAQGYSSVEDSTPVSMDTLFRIFSMTKPITTVGAMILYESALFQLDDPVSEYLPALKDMSVLVSGNGDDHIVEPANTPITIKHLMTHTAGFTYAFLDSESPLNEQYISKDLDYNSQGAPLSEWIEDVAATPLSFHPGSRWKYSIATDVLGHLIEVIAGQPLDVFLKDHVLDPLEMSETSFSVPDSLSDRFASLYKYKTGDRFSLLESKQDSQFRGEIKRFQGGGGLVSTASDFLRFQQMMLNKGSLDGNRVLGRKTVEFMTQNHLDGDLASMGQPKFGEVSFNGIGFGLGVAVVIDPPKTDLLSSRGEYNWGGAASTAFWNDPAEELAVVFLTQLYPSDTYPIRRELRVLVNQAIVD